MALPQVPQRLPLLRQSVLQRNRQNRQQFSLHLGEQHPGLQALQYVEEQYAGASVARQTPLPLLAVNLRETGSHEPSRGAGKEQESSSRADLLPGVEHREREES